MASILQLVIEDFVVNCQVNVIVYQLKKKPQKRVREVRARQTREYPVITFASILKFECLASLTRCFSRWSCLAFMLNSSILFCHGFRKDSRCSRDVQYTVDEEYGQVYKGKPYFSTRFAYPQE